MMLHTTTAHLQCHERKKSYYDLILKQKHAYILQFQAFFSTTNFPKKNCVVYFLPSKYEKQKNFPVLLQLSRRFWKSFYVLILKSLCLNLLKEFQRTKKHVYKLTTTCAKAKNDVYLCARSFSLRMMTEKRPISIINLLHLNSASTNICLWNWFHEKTKILWDFFEWMMKVPVST